MSTILKALEKAHETREAHSADGGKQGHLVAGSTRERHLEEEAARHRRRNRVLGLCLAGTVVTLGGTVALLGGRKPEMPLPQRNVAPQAAAPPHALVPKTPVIAPSPSPAAAPPSPLPTPPPTPEPTASPSPVPATPLPSPTPPPTAAPTPAPTARFFKDQVIDAAAAGIRMTGVFLDGANSSVLIDGATVDIGRKYKGVRPLAILRDARMIEAEVDDAGREVHVYIRY
ncbi:hypothetical protein HZA57_01350 [Candidatus Poribacteria bacterium]|nr:hypothetical protein [Candidatus Poribacteria bacterium]